MPIMGLSHRNRQNSVILASVVLGVRRLSLEQEAAFLFTQLLRRIILTRQDKPNLKQRLQPSSMLEKEQ